MRRTTLSRMALTVLAFAVPAAVAPQAAEAGPGAVYTMSNAADGNEIIAFQRGPHGTLTPDGTYETGGLGTGGGLGNQGGVVLSRNHRRLFAVNAGSNDISAFVAGPGGLTLTDVEPSLGELPISLALHGDLLYVLNGGGAGSIQGFTVDRDGDLDPIPDSMRALSGADMTAPAQIGFTPGGGVLVVTEKATSSIDTYVVLDDGTTTGPSVFASSGQTPFGFDFAGRDYLLVSEAFGGMPGMSAASSYLVGSDGSLEVINGTVPCFQTAACWLVVSNNSRYAYMTNTGSGTITGWAVHKPSGMISLLDADGVTADVGPDTGPLDASFSRNGRYLYTLNSGSQEIGVYRVLNSDGSLVPVETVGGLPESANGLAAH